VTLYIEYITTLIISFKLSEKMRIEKFLTKEPKPFQL